MPAAVPLAIVGGAVIGAVASNKAAKTQAAATASANNEAAREYDQTRQDQLAQLAQQRADQAPWLEAGKNALAKIASGVDLPSDPGYQFRLNQGTQGIQRAASARGGLYSGATLKALARFNQDTASNEYGASWNRLASIAGLGQTATNQVGQAGQNAYGTIASAGMNASNNIGQNLMSAANARASGYVGGANAFNNGLSQYMNYNQNQNLLDKIAEQNQRLADLSRNPSYGSAAGNVPANTSAGVYVPESSLPSLQMPTLNTPNLNF